MQRLFRRYFGSTPQRWLREQRLKAAWDMLGSAGSVKQVTIALGFRQESQFSRDFKSRFGCTPSTHMSRVTKRRQEAVSNACQGIEISVERAAMFGDGAGPSVRCLEMLCAG